MRVVWSEHHAAGGASVSAAHPAPAAWTDLPTPARVLVQAVVAAGVLALVFTLPSTLANPVLVGGLLTAALIAAPLSLQTPFSPSRVSIGYVFDMLALVLAGRDAAIVIAAVSAAAQSLRPGGRSPAYRVAYNAAAMVVTMTGAGWAFAVLGGRQGPSEPLALARPLVGATLAYYLANTGLVASAVALSRDTHPVPVWHRQFLGTAPGYFAGAALAWGAAYLWRVDLIWFVPLVLAPGGILFQWHRAARMRAQDQAAHQAEIARLHADTRAAVDAARRSEERYALMADGSKDGLWDWDVQADALYCSDRWKLMIGLSTDDELATLHAWMQCILPDDRPGFRRALDAHLTGETPHFEHEYRMLHRNGGVRSVLCRGTVVRRDGVPVRMAGSQTDVTESRRVQDTLSHAARHDPLTGLPNRMLFGELLQKAIAQFQQGQDLRYGVLFIDLDGFKLVNDSLGHLVGDQFLFAIAQRLQAALRAGDVLARLGGDEFAVLVRNLAPQEDIRRVTERLRDAIASPFTLQGHQLYAAASIGVVVGNDAYRSVDEVLRDADTAMYRAKANRRGGYELFDQSMHEHALRRLTLETKIRQAVERREFVVHYQPIVHLGTGEITGVEALVRWMDPDHTMVPPSEFIPAAEDTGLVVPLTYFVLNESCRQVAEWQRQFGRALDVSVNVSSQLFSRHEFVDQVAAAVRTKGLRPGSLHIEITESTLLNGSDFVDATFQRLRQLPVSIYLDDFGTGYSSLSFLQRYPVDVLKLDKSFVAHMGTPGEDCRIGNAIVTLARELGLGLIAEGVETQAQASHLEHLGCPHAQGFLFSGPLPPEALSRRLTRSSSLSVA